ncbi:MAG: T9SS type A sorting domain-containing protein [Prevotella sp.]|jgi:hypothetical protein|nr:T9SS type A sorting domain-containing protein [Prevotella sp.]
MKQILFSLLFIVLSGTMNAQKIQYAYDAAGNRIKREIVLTKSASETESSFFTEELAQRTIKIYPNPTEGQLKVEVSDFEDCKSVNLTIVNMQGQVVLRKKMNSATDDLDISGKASGLYVLRINIDGEYSSWKIIKK